MTPEEETAMGAILERLDKIEARLTALENKNQAFRPPTVEQVREYMIQQYGGDHGAEGFVDYYQQVGWVVGKTRKKMRDWQAAVRLWCRDKTKTNGSRTMQLL